MIQIHILQTYKFNLQNDTDILSKINLQNPKHDSIKCGYVDLHDFDADPDSVHFISFFII